jgi:hypothetical protein
MPVGREVAWSTNTLQDQSSLKRLMNHRFVCHEDTNQYILRQSEQNQGKSHDMLERKTLTNVFGL